LTTQLRGSQVDIQRSIELLALALEIIGELPKGHAELADQ
jgi:hypothetical protein